jgi:hypothetical protein
MNEDLNSKQSNTHQERFSFRTVAILPILFFIPAVALYLINPGLKIGHILGIIFHMLVIFVISRLPTPQWAKAAAYCGIALDITSGVMSLYNLPSDIALSLRLSAHLLSAMWFISASLLRKPLVIKILGVTEGLWIGLYTFFGSVLPITALAPASVISVVWYGVLAYKYPTTPQEGS